MNAPIAQILQQPTMAISAVGMVFPETWSFEEWKAVGPTLCIVDGSVQWWLGDWIRFGKQRWGKQYTEAFETTGFEHQTLRGAKYVADRFELSRRRHKLSWSHHRVVASLDATYATRLLDVAERDGLSVTALRCHVGRPCSE